MGGVCSSVSSFVSIALDAAERISLCTVCAMLTCCLLFTIIAVMVMGVGIGYHYCFVQNSVESMAKAAKAAGALRSDENARRQGNVMRSMDKAMHRGYAHRMSRREANSPLANNNRTLSNNFTDIINNSSNFAATKNLTVMNVLFPLNLETFNATNVTVF